MTIKFTRAEVESAIRRLYYDRTDIMLLVDTKIVYMHHVPYEPDAEVYDNFEYIEIDRD